MHPHTPAIQAELNPEVCQSITMVAWTLLVLLALAALTCWASYQHLGPARMAVGLGIAACKIALVAWLFMQLRQAHAYIALALMAACLTVSLLFGLSATDYAVRPAAQATYQVPQQVPPMLTKPR